MSEVRYALIKNNEVINVLLFDDPSQDLLDLFKEEHMADRIVLASEKAGIGGTYDGENFWRIQPYPSWIKNEELNEWQPPVPYPIIEEGSDEYYVWDENTTSWLLLPPA